MGAIEKIKGRQAYGGVRCNKVEICRSEQIFSSFGDHFNNAINGAVVPFFEPFYEVNAKADSITFSEQQVEKNGSEMYESTITMIILLDEKDRLESVRMITALAQVVKFTDYNGITRVMGTQYNGARATFSRDHKNQMLSPREMILKLTYTNPLPVPEIAE